VLLAAIGWKGDRSSVGGTNYAIEASRQLMEFEGLAA
jgi:hypothetical protein